ncbi:hypothetical protein E1180_02960 [Roseibium denhamense]|uniref:Uncharacterized protein n=1 Tax=Roseibium denhamense TaxID=76305 RepID=A0ABY1P861_9HYPH|nr:hypothetical protein [Roseibium denhamense]MTI04477.1 hypothetical protein [Roseibium denhamense]SMP28623.1 hypothetical protein SAMN06265374_2954 [Roseibium denhamense]
MANTIERPKGPQSVAHATEYPADRDGHGAGQHKKRDAQRPDQEPGSSNEEPAVLVDDHHYVDHALDGVAAYRATALSVLEPGIDHGPVQPLRGPAGYTSADNIRHAYEDPSADEDEHTVNVAT